jgi:hypothetical protein
MIHGMMDPSRHVREGSIMPITDEDAGKNFLLEKADDANNGDDPRD